MIFNSEEGQDEGREKDKLLFHWTKDTETSLNEQIDDICLCDASITASVKLNSTPSSQSDSLKQQISTTQSSRLSLDSNDRSLVLRFETTLIVIVLVEPEQSIWMAAHVSPASLPPTSSESSTEASNLSLVDLNCIPVHAVEQIIRNIYVRFCLLNGTFRMISDEAFEESKSNSDTNRNVAKTKVREKLRLICKHYFNDVLPDIHLSSTILSLAQLHNYIVYLSLNPITLMKVNSFINHLVCINATRILGTIVIFNDQLLWSTLDMDDTRLVYNYLVGVLIKDAIHEELSRETDKVRRLKEDLPLYLNGLYNMSKTEQESMLALSLSDDQPRNQETSVKLTKFYMTVFRSSNNMTLGLVLKDPNQTELINKCEQILTSDSRLGVIPLASLAQSVGQNFIKSSSSTIQQSGLNATSSSASSRKRASNSGSNSMKLFASSVDQIFLCLDRLNGTVIWSSHLENQSREHSLQIGLSDTSETKGKKLRLIKFMLELESEARDIKNQSGALVQEFLGKTISDNWLTVINSNYRNIYSIYKLRNACLNEAHQYAINLDPVIAFANHRP